MPYVGTGPAGARGRQHRRPIAVRRRLVGDDQGQARPRRGKRGRRRRRRSRRRPVRAAWSAILLAFAATWLAGVALGETAPAAPIVSDVPVAGGIERVLFLGGQQARATVLLLPGGDGIIGLDS